MYENSIGLHKTSVNVIFCASQNKRWHMPESQENERLYISLKFKKIFTWDKNRITKDTTRTIKPARRAKSRLKALVGQVVV